MNCAHKCCYKAMMYCVALNFPCVSDVFVNLLSFRSYAGKNKVKSIEARVLSNQC